MVPGVVETQNIVWPNEPSYYNPIVGVDYFERLSSLNFVLLSGDNSNLNFAIFDETYYQYIFEPDNLQAICFFHNKDGQVNGLDLFDRQANIKRCGVASGNEFLVELEEDERIVGFVSHSVQHAVHIDF
jgi:hypothetical protein